MGRIMLKRVFKLALICCLLLMLSGCSKNSSQETVDGVPDNQSDDFYYQVTATPTPYADENDEKVFLDALTLNIFINNNPIGYELNIESFQEVELDLFYSINIDGAYSEKTAPACIRIIQDGTPVDFEFDGQKSEAEELYLDVEIGKEHSSKLKFNMDETIENVYICILYFPDFVPEDYFNAFSRRIDYNINNTGYSKKEIDAGNDEFIVMNDMESTGLDIGTECLSEDNQTIHEQHSINGDLFKEDDIYIKFYPVDTGRYYLHLICDGELLPAFDGEVFKFVEFPDENSAYQWKIDNNILPNDGIHYLDVIAYSVGGYDSITSFRVRINCEVANEE